MDKIPPLPTALAELVKEGEDMKKRHIREQRIEDLGMKVLFALMCPPLALFPSFWRDK